MTGRPGKSASSTAKPNVASWGFCANELRPEKIRGGLVTRSPVREPDSGAIALARIA